MSISVLLSDFKVRTSASERQSPEDVTIVMTDRKSQSRRDGERKAANDWGWRVVA
jgi:hypothetical protein